MNIRPKRTTVDKARRRQEQIAADRIRRTGRLGDRELHAFLVVPYPSLSAQVN